MIVVGAGPIGLECAVRLQQAGQRVLMLEKGALGQTITWFPRQMRFFSSNDRIAICGVPIQTVDQQKATREEYLAYLRQVARIFAVPVRTYSPVVDIQRSDAGFTVRCAAGGAAPEFAARRVVLANGGLDLPRRLGVPGEELPHVSHYFEEPHRYFGRRLLIVGGGNSAVEAALRCFHAGASVSLSYRRDEFDAGSVKYWLLPELQSRLARGEITGHLGTVPVAITHDGVSLRRTGGDESSVIAADDVLLLTGYVADPMLFRRCGVELEEPGGVPVFDPDTMQTAIPGLYIAGTAIAGTQERYEIFLENCHAHVERIVAHITGREPGDEKPVPAPPPRYDLPES